ncbi:MAG: inverse autotransporter beta domain-containing protein [Parachlamydiaceae bacterium]
MQNIFFTLLTLAVSLLSAEENELFLKTGASAGRYISLKENYLETGIFYAPNWEDNWIPLIDTSFYRLEDDNWAASAGVGVRYNACDSERLWGANLYYDCRGFKFRDYCNCQPLGKERRFLSRIGIGFESLGPCFDFRVNGYIPVGSSKFQGRETSFNNIGNGYYASFHKNETNPYGIDGKIGFRTPSYCDFSLYSAIGGYYYFHDDFKDIVGPQARLALLYSDIAELEAIYTYDRCNNSCFQGRLMFYLPIDALWNCCDCFCSPCLNLFKQPIRRNGVIFTDRRCSWNYNW